ncbi:hypothetical protein J0383_00485 [Flavobacterium endoglycinae]|uniref:Beta-lactamase-inhibitor-like PepSY-like domain-containing protein n=1 Tax=Flavobacterium endoglycinae TaxID=2816357 RepID=A0ABX7QEC2_9FLAO|nr:hypothetical protein [Flavobacterium endoglycinae]QSW89307.1 hypothetical protein J0383_00485 [Flavobacterium endoglycinae]
MKKLIIATIICSILVSCQQIKQSINETFKPNDTVVEKEHELVQEQKFETSNSETTANEKIVLLEHPEILQKAEEELKKLPQYAGKEIFVYSTVYFYNYRSINVLLQHPKNPKYVDTYEYKDGKWSEPRPVQLSVHDDIKGRLVPLSKINFVNASKVAEIYNQKASEIEGAEPLTSVYISIWKNQIKWYPTSIHGSRERYSIQFNDDGSLKEFKQD